MPGMTLVALGLVLAAAVLHATWNLLAKRAQRGGTEFVWLVATAAALLYAPIGLVVLLRSLPLTGLQLGFMAGSGLLHVVYFLVLQHGYAVGDLSVVYPIARGTGPLLATVGAVAVLGERPSGLALAGAVAVSAGVLGMSWGSRATDGSRPAGVGYGLATGVIIASYTLWDGHAMAALAIPPLVYDWVSNVARSILLAPVAAVRRRRIREVWTAHRREVLLVGLLSPAAYILVLVALGFTPVSYVAPARETSILIGTFLGARLLAEGNLPRRLAGAGAIVAGVVALALG